MHRCPDTRQAETRLHSASKSRLGNQQQLTSEASAWNQKVPLEEEECVCVGGTYPVLVGWRSTVSTQARGAARTLAGGNTTCICKGANDELHQVPF